MLYRICLIKCIYKCKIKLEKFQFGTDKCNKLHVGCKSEGCPDLFLDTWKIQELDEYMTVKKTLIDITYKEYKIETSEVWFGVKITLSTHPPPTQKLKDITLMASRTTNLSVALLSQGNKPFRVRRWMGGWWWVPGP